MAVKIYFARHGQTTGDVEDRYGGDYDDHLTKEGKLQTKNLAKQLNGKDIEIIFTSPKNRAMETAQILQKTIGSKIEVVGDLRERNQYGILSGVVKSEALKKYPEMVELLKDYKNTIKGAESYESCKGRILKTLTQVCQSGYQTIAVVTHGGPIRVIVRNFYQDIGKINVDDCAFVEIEYNHENLKIVSLHGISF